MDRARRHSIAQPEGVQRPEGTDLASGLGDGSSALMWYLSQFSRLALRAHNNKFVCRHGGDGALKASFMHSRQGWLKKNQEVFAIEWHGDASLGDGSFGVRVRSVSHPHPHGHQRHLLAASSSDTASLATQGVADISPYFALRADNGHYWRVTYPQGLLMTADVTDESPTVSATVADGHATDEQPETDPLSEEPGNGGDKLAPRQRTDEELFTIEVQHANRFTIRNKATGTYVEVREDGSLWCDPSATLQISIKDSQLFLLAFKVAFKTAQGLYVSAPPSGGLMPSRKTIDRREVFLIQLGPQNTCTIATTKKRRETKLTSVSISCWRVGKKGVVDADGKSNNEPVKEELFTIDRPRNRYGAGWTIRSASNLLYLRPEGNKRIIADSEYSPSTAAPQDPNCYFALVFPEQGEAEDDASTVAEERKRHAIRESGGLKKLRRIIETFEVRTEDLLMEDQKDPEYRMFEGETVALVKHHMLSFHRCEAAMGTAVITNYRLAFCPDDPKAAEKGAHCFSFPLTLITKITKIGPITTEAGNYRGIQIVLKDFRTYYFCSIPFTSIRKPKMDTFFQVLEDQTFPTRLSDFFAFAHRSALAAEVECPKHFSRAVRKAIAEPRLASWKAESPLITFSDGFAMTDSGESFPTRRFPRVGRARQVRNERERLINEQAARSADSSPAGGARQEVSDGHNTEHGIENQDTEKGLNHVEELGQLKSELFGMASHSPVAAPLFAKEVETRWAATKAASTSPEPKDRFANSPFLSSRTIAQNGWELYSPMDDYGRLELDVSPWRISPINWDYGLCETYPRLLVVPAVVSDEEIKQVKQFRSKGRIPVPTWRHRESGSIIVRCSQPKTGLLSDRSEQDEKLVSSIRQACGAQCTVYLIDARPRVNAVMNTLTGAGVENAAVYNIHHDNRIFLGIPNIHVVRDSSLRLTKIIDVWNLTTTLSDWADPIQNQGAESNGGVASGRMAQKQAELFDRVTETGWLDHITALLSGALSISNLILESSSTGVPVAIIVHCSDGWDRTPQLVALTQLLLDPHYRTIHGFEILIEKEFLSFGHRFQDRCGHHGKKDRDQRSPIFHQFLECAWQLLQQFPSAFEFNELFLETVLEHVYSCRFGTFLTNSAKECADSKLAEKTCSLWTTINGFASDGDDEANQSAEDNVSTMGVTSDAPLVRVNSKENATAPATTASVIQSSDDEREGDEQIADGVDWDAVVRRRRKYVNPRYIHGRHHHLMPVINLCQRDASQVSATAAPTSPPSNTSRKLSGGSAAVVAEQKGQGRRNSAPDSQDSVAEQATGRRKSSASKTSARAPSPLGFASSVSGNVRHAGGVLSDEDDLSDPDLYDDFEVVDEPTGEEDQAVTAAVKEKSRGGGITGLGREDVEDMLEYLGNKWRRAGIGLYHGAIDRTRGPGPEVGSIRFWAALYLRWHQGDVLFPTPLPAAFLSPASMPASPALPDAPATMVVAAAAAAPTTAIAPTTVVRSPPASPKRLRRSASSAPALSAGRYSAPVVPSSSVVPDSLSSTLSGGPALYARKNNSGEMSLHARVQLSELKRTATKTKADAALFSFTRSSRAD